MRRFVVVYEATESEVRVVRILHGARRLAAELDREPGDDG
jgi:plasmid stabilization system protein ParE